MVPVRPGAALAASVPNVRATAVGVALFFLLAAGIVAWWLRGLVADDLPVHGVLCFIKADWPLIGGSFTTRGVEALWPKRLYPKLKADGPLKAETVAEVHRRLASSLPPA